MSEKNQIKKKTKTIDGVVVSNSCDKTITVKTTRIVKHPLYGKYIKRISKIHAHDPDNSCEIGAKVSIQECRPLSKTKSWIVVK